jgi:hypothetical protein
MAVLFRQRHGEVTSKDLVVSALVSRGADLDAPGLGDIRRDDEVGIGGTNVSTNTGRRFSCQSGSWKRL